MKNEKIYISDLCTYMQRVYVGKLCQQVFKYNSTATSMDKICVNLFESWSYRDVWFEENEIDISKFLSFDIRLCP